MAQEIKELAIEFNVRETEVGAEQEALLLKFIEILRDKKYKKIIIEGHACAHGNKKLNLLISKKRALSAKRYLQAHGIQRHISIKYFGEERLKYKEIPTPDNINDPHVKANRRVRIIARW
ncbi:MAG: OmpA family protein [Thermodesulfovibrionales bacterium]